VSPVKIVIKIGGDLVKGEFPFALLKDISKIGSKNQIIFVHGGGDVVTEIANKLGKEQRFVVSPDGIRSRYTDKETIDIYTMVMCGLIAKKLVQILASQEIKAVSISGLDGSILKAKRKKKLLTIDEDGRKFLIEGGYTGKMQSIESNLIDALLERGFVPVISPVAIGEENEPLNVDSDRAAAYLAIGIHADSVIFLTDVNGLMLDEKLVEQLSLEEAKKSLPKIGFGMQKKVLAGIEAVEGGVSEALICSGLRGEPITNALIHQGCTVIKK
jgi:acetylglutamate/LysW-gamma-L-alpha-aminoadipate kinase